MKDLPRALARYTVPPPDPRAVARAAACLQTVAEARLPRMTDREFLRRQLGFISLRMWVLQGGFAALLTAWVLSTSGQGMAQDALYPVLGASAPLLVLINITDWMRIYNGGMLELELATRFSLTRVAAARMLIFGISDTALLLALCAVSAAAARTGLLMLLVRMLAPFNAMCAGCLWLLRRVRPEQLALGAVLLAAGLAAAMVLACNLRTPLPMPAWVAALAAATAALACQGRAFAKQGRGDLLCKRCAVKI